ncbi:MAG TPA: 2-methylcitrate dehydratase [Gammaproteobacteria bacterium]|nr:2-methylcitrate dehydratase [Gammaproteobacteria bacterium]
MDYPIGHCRRRDEGIPALLDKFDRNLATQFSEQQSKQIIDACSTQQHLESMSVNEFSDLWVN